MKTFKILPWYFLLLMVGLCVAMSTREGMIVSAETVESTYSPESGVNILKTKADEFLKSTLKTKRNVYLIVTSSTYQGRTNMTKVIAELNKNKTVDYILFISKDNIKMNMILKRIADTPSQLSATNDLILLTVNPNFKPPMAETQLYTPAPSTAFDSIKGIITRFTTSPKK